MTYRTTKAMLALLLGASFSQGLLAQNTNFTNGDLVLFFQKPGDDDTIYVGLGSAANLYRGSAAGPTADRQATNIINVNAALTAAYGAGWASDPEIYAGLIACRSSATGTQIFDGDHTRTLYSSRTRLSVGTVGSANSSPWDFTLSGASTGGATQAIGFNNTFETNYLTQIAISPTAVSTIDGQNPFVDVSQGIQDIAFNAFPGGIQQRGAAASFGSFGPVSNAEFMLDLYRTTARPDEETAGTEVAGVSRIGSYEGTMVIGTDGNVSFITQGSGVTPFESWIAKYPAITDPNDKLPMADRDNDGFSNLVEFALGGNPSAADSSIAPVLNASGSNFVFSFNRSDDSESTSTLVFQYGANFSSWTDATVGAGNSTSGDATIVVTENGAGADTVTVTIPKSAAPGAKLFGRLKVTQ